MTTWRLAGITASKGSCEHCGRSLSRLFRVINPDGRDMIVGRTCSAKLTGYNWTVAQAERTEALGYRAAQAQIMLRDERERWMSDDERMAFVRGLLVA